MKISQVLLTGVSLFGLLQSVRADLINFDTVADGTQINTTYPSITFSNPGQGVPAPANANIYARASTGAASPSNVVTVFPTGLPFFDRRWGGVQAVFATPQRRVSIDARTVMPPEYVGSVVSRPFLQAWDTSNNFLGVVYFAGDQRQERWETLTITSATANIGRIQFACQYDQTGATTAVYALFDNLNFETANVQNVSATVTRAYQKTMQSSILYRDQAIQLRNTGTTTINGPIHLRVINPSWTLANATGTYNGQPYITVTTGSLAPNATVSVNLRFLRPIRGRVIPSLTFDTEVYAGTF